MSANRPIELTCTSSGSRPPAVLSWWRGNQQVRYAYVGHHRLLRGEERQRNRNAEKKARKVINQASRCDSRVFLLSPILLCAFSILPILFVPTLRHILLFFSTFRSLRSCIRYCSFPARFRGLVPGIRFLDSCIPCVFTFFANGDSPFLALLQFCVPRYELVLRICMERLVSSDAFQVDTLYNRVRRIQYCDLIPLLPSFLRPVTFPLYLRALETVSSCMHYSRRIFCPCCSRDTIASASTSLTGSRFLDCIFPETFHPRTHVSFPHVSPPRMASLSFRGSYTLLKPVPSLSAFCVFFCLPMQKNLPSETRMFLEEEEAGCFSKTPTHGVPNGR